MKEGTVRYNDHTQQGVIERMEAFAGRRRLIAPSAADDLERWKEGLRRLSAKLSERMPVEVAVTVGLALVEDREPGGTPDPYRVNAGLTLLGTKQATTYLARQPDLFYRALDMYGRIKPQQQRLMNTTTPERDGALYNVTQIALNLVGLLGAVKGDTQRTQAINRVLLPRKFRRAGN